MSVLPMSTPSYQFRGVSQCLYTFERELERYEREGGSGNPYIIFAMGDRGFRDLKNSQESLLIKSIVEYDDASHTALFRMETTIHAVAASAFADTFLLWKSQFPELRLLHTTTSSVRGPSGKNKSPDGAWKPAILPYNREAKWPSMVLEAKSSERRPKLEEDMRFWLEGSRGQCTLAEQSLSRNGPSTTKNILFTEQKMTVVRTSAPNCDRITGQLPIRFEDVFLKPKKPGETDFQLSQTQLEDIANEIWTVQFTRARQQS
ncbi:hypothetical protein N7481_009998 [Penicillium waksmanii]|uniref:uncharacterized protein n=1 Tax=Penicillium waksmanii TaxID=69791 RepID=UPI0025469739|nr:uncharacterized protein N7481_009998 [Penicillium waksmanii]KAJ5976291.1 hypothetical protein N7481_009998 [Penicillium waksmanii]